MAEKQSPKGQSERSLNTPFTREQIRNLPRARGHFARNERGHMEWVETSKGFTPTSHGFTGQQLKRISRVKPYSTTNRRTTAGRSVQRIPIYLRDENGKLPVDAAGREVKKLVSFKTVWHRRLDREMNV